MSVMHQIPRARQYPDEIRRKLDRNPVWRAVHARLDAEDSAGVLQIRQCKVHLPLFGPSGQLRGDLNGETKGTPAEPRSGILGSEIWLFGDMPERVAPLFKLPAKRCGSD